MRAIQCHLQIMSSVDKLKLLAGLPIPLSDFSLLVHPATLIEIAKLGISKYFAYVNLLTLKKEEIKKLIKEAEEIDPFDFLIINSKHKEEFKKQTLEALKYFIREEVFFIPDMDCFVIGDFSESRFLTKDNFSEFQGILTDQNSLEKDNFKYVGENEAAKIIKEKIERGKKEIERVKNNRDNIPIEIADLVGSLTINSSLNIYNVWDISYYAFNDQFKRMRLLEQYNTGLQSIMAGADPKKIKLQDWIQSIQ